MDAVNYDIAAVICRRLELADVLRARLACRHFAAVFVNPPVKYAEDIHGYCIYVARHDVVVTLSRSPRGTRDVSTVGSLQINPSYPVDWFTPVFTHKSLANFPLFPALIYNGRTDLFKLKSIFGAQVVKLAAFMSVNDANGCGLGLPQQDILIKDGIIYKLSPEIGEIAVVCSDQVRYTDLHTIEKIGGSLNITIARQVNWAICAVEPVRFNPPRAVRPRYGSDRMVADLYRTDSEDDNVSDWGDNCDNSNW